MTFYVLCGIAAIALILFLRTPRGNQGKDLSFMRQMSLGNTLVSMTDAVEKIEAASAALPIGMGGGIDSLPLGQQSKASDAITSGLATLSSYDPQTVTLGLLGNMAVSIKQGRSFRVQCQSRLLDLLVAGGVAVPARDVEGLANA